MNLSGDNNKSVLEKAYITRADSAAAPAFVSAEKRPEN